MKNPKMSSKMVIPMILINGIAFIVLLLGCTPDDCMHPNTRKEVRSLDFQSLIDNEYHGNPNFREEIMPGHDFSKSGIVTLYLLENSSISGEVLEIYLVSKDRSKQFQFRIPGNGKDNLSNYSIAMIPDTFNEGPPCIQISLISGPGEKYDEIVALVRKKS